MFSFSKTLKSIRKEEERNKCEEKRMIKMAKIKRKKISKNKKKKLFKESEKKNNKKEFAVSHFKLNG